jgi:aminopeptidase YwaD
MSAYQGLARETISGERAKGVVAFMDHYFRLPGNTGFNASLERVVSALKEAGYVEEASGGVAGGRRGSPGSAPLTYRLEHRPLAHLTWEPVSATLTLGDGGAPLLDYATNRNLVAINSFSTPLEGVEAEVVDVGTGSAADFEGKDVKGKIVFGETSIGRLFSEAVQKRGAVGVLAYRIPAFNHPEEHPKVISFTSIPQDTTARAWGLVMSYAARQKLRAALAAGPVRARVRVETRLYPSEELTLVAEVRGTREPDHRFVYSAHVQEPGANDNATGVADLAEVAGTLAAGVHSGVFVPARTVTMIWGDEIASTRRYLQEDSVRARGVGWGLSLDMVGEDTEKTGGTFLIEKMPDPSAVWTRGDDHHTEWGGSPMTVDRLTPHYFNDFVLNRCLDQGADNGWVVRTNPFEGGSDHVPFLQAGVPGVLFWHFTDVYYHTDGDRVGMVSPVTLKNVAVCAAVSGMTLASADEEVASFVVDETERAAVDRLAREEALSRAAVAAGGDRGEQRGILEAWASWYDGALAHTSEIQVGGSSPVVMARIREARARVAEAGRKAEQSLGAPAPGVRQRSGGPSGG